MKNKQYNQDYNDFSENPLAPLFYQYIGTLKTHHFHKEAEDLLQLAWLYYLLRNRSIITKIIITMQMVVVSDKECRFEQLLQQL